MPGRSIRRIDGDDAHAGLTDNDASEPDLVTIVCSRWLSRHSEQEQLTRRWQALETRLFRDHNWCALSEAERNSLPQAVEFEALNQKIGALHDLNREQLTTVKDLAATTVHGLVCKLSVALAIVLPDENEEAHDLLRSILRDIETVWTEPDRGHD